KEICENFLGIDPAEEWIPVRPTQHYSMGGIRTKYTGESQTLKGLYSCGEAACWDMHGFNRLGGNSVSETVVSGMLVAEYIADFCETEESTININTAVIEKFVHDQQCRLERFIDNKNGEDAYVLRRAMEKIMMDKVGIFRNGKDLKDAVDELEKLLFRSHNIEVTRSKSLAANPALVNAYRTHRMIKVALSVAYGALLRTESRGAHAREDFPERNDKEWMKRTIMRWEDHDHTMPSVSYEPIEIETMELPPGFRGYGKDNTITNFKSALRQKQVDKIRAEIEEEGLDRYEVQRALMHYEEMLPEKYRERNERLDERLDDGK
ncbi:MAG: fumarate reductase flavoprotein subunit, partial [Epsilonproteobacteria bacterium]